MLFCIIASLCLLSIATAQTVTKLVPCLTGETNDLRVDCEFTPAESPESPEPQCKYTLWDQMLASTSPNDTQNPHYKNRAKVLLMGANVCRFTLLQPDDKPNNFTCHIKQTEVASKTKRVWKKLLDTCSALSLLQSASRLLLVLMTTSLLLELL